MVELGWASGWSESTACSLCSWAPRNRAGESESAVLMKGKAPITRRPRTANKRVGQKFPPEEGRRPAHPHSCVPSR